MMHNAYTRTDSHLNMRIQSRADPHGAEISVLMSNISLKKIPAESAAPSFHGLQLTHGAPLPLRTLPV